MMCKIPHQSTESSRTCVSLKEHKSALYWMCMVHTQWNLSICVKRGFLLGFYVVYRLLRRAERHHCVFSMLPARQQQWKLQLCHGKPFPVRRHETACTICKYCARVWLFCPSLTQVRHKHAGAPGGRRLYDCVPEWRHTPQENSWIYMDQKVLSNDWQKVKVAVYFDTDW